MVGVAVPFEVGVAPFWGVFESPTGSMFTGAGAEVLTVGDFFVPPFVVLLGNRKNVKNALLPSEDPAFFPLDDDKKEEEIDGVFEVLLLSWPRVGLPLALTTTAAASLTATPASSPPLAVSESVRALFSSTFTSFSGDGFGRLAFGFGIAAYNCEITTTRTRL